MALPTATPVVKPLSEAITAELPRVTTNRPYDPDNFILARDTGGLRTVCLGCSEMYPDTTATLGDHNRWAEKHWVVSHT